MQSGIAIPEHVTGLVSLGSIYYEPLWVFYRGANDLSTLNDFVGKRIATGAEGSATRALTLQLMRAVGAKPESTRFEALGGDAAAEALVAGRVDAAFIVAAPDVPVVERSTALLQ